MPSQESSQEPSQMYSQGICQTSQKVSITIKMTIKKSSMMTSKTAGWETNSLRKECSPLCRRCQEMSRAQ